MGKGEKPVKGVDNQAQSAEEPWRTSLRIIPWNSREAGAFIHQRSTPLSPGVASGVCTLPTLSSYTATGLMPFHCCRDRPEAEKQRCKLQGGGAPS